MSSHCTKFPCDGNCAGCSGGDLWCSDPRCFPYCQDCELVPHYDDAVNAMFFYMILTIVILILLVIIVFDAPVFRTKQFLIEQ